MSLVQGPWKIIAQPVEQMGDGVPIVDGDARVRIELSIQGDEPIVGEAGIDVVFLIDQSKSMRETNDPGRVRFSAVREIANEFIGLGRDNIDRVSIVTFAGKGGPEKTVVWCDWCKWSEMEVFLGEYLDGVPEHPPPSATFTPMDKGMEVANSQLFGSSARYKMVVMLADGQPEPDTWEQQDEIQTVHIRDARIHEIIYSTILLGIDDPTDEASLLMMSISQQTDIIHNPTINPATNRPYFAFSASNVDQIVNTYRTAMRLVINRIAAYHVNLTEVVNTTDLIIEDPELLVSRDEGYPNHFVESYDLGDSLTQFVNSGSFHVQFLELVGSATLVFYVRMRWEGHETDDAYIEVEVNKPAHCQLGYIHGNLGYLPIQVEWPQLKIRFRTGIIVRKRLLEEGDENYVTITVANYRSQPLEWCWIKENPASNVNISEIVDNFEFKPFRELAIRHLLDKTYSWYRLSIPAGSHAQFESDLQDYYNDLVAEFSEDLDPYLCRFRFGSLDNGIFKLAQNIPPMGTRELKFKVSGTSFFGPALIGEPVDNSGSGKKQWLSRYRHPETTGSRPDALWELIEQNPLFVQYSTPNPTPDLCAYNGMGSLIDLFYEIIIGIRPLYKEVDLDSDTYSPLIDRFFGIPELTPTGLHGADEPFGLSVAITNKGNAPGTAPLSLRSIFIPFPKPHLPAEEWDSHWQCILETPPITVDAGQTLTQTFSYTKMIKADGTEVDVLPEIPRDFDGWIISTVDIAPADGELRTCNNKGLGIVMKMKVPPPVLLHPSVRARLGAVLVGLFRRRDRD